MEQRHASPLIFRPPGAAMGRRAMLPLALVTLICPQFAVARTPAEFTIDCRFPGGNIVVDSIENNTVKLHQDLRDTEGFWFYWSFRVRGAAGRTLDFEFTQESTGPGTAIGFHGPAVSTDKGKTWNWLGNESRSGRSFGYKFPVDAKEVRFAFAIPYLQSDLRQFLRRYRGNSNLRQESLCKTNKGRTVELLRIGRLDGRCDWRVLLTARHHACESMANCAMDGVIETILADTDDGRWYRDHVEVLAVPFMDKDGVEEGDQGKNRRPHDHNRDYVQGLYPSVRALRDLVPRWSAGRLRIALDMHCPLLRDRTIFFTGGRSVERFSKIVESLQTGPLVYRLADSLPAWARKSGDTGRVDSTPRVMDSGLRSCSSWAAGLPGILLATTMEIPYADVSGKRTTPEGVRALGHDLAHAIRSYLEESKK
jgi:hypothetical protein